MNVYTVTLRGEWPREHVPAGWNSDKIGPRRLLTRWVVAGSRESAIRIVQNAHPEATEFQNCHLRGPESCLSSTSLPDVPGSATNVTIEFSDCKFSYAQPGLLSARPGEVVLRENK